jgi:tRNA nucleotidyltransferase/poly(A) polymerase
MADYAYLLENRLSLNQRRALEKVRDIARDHGMTVFLAGGAVRDLSTGFPVRDLDFTVQGNALKLKKSLEKAGAVLWGEHEPSRTMFFWFHGGRVEVSSARREEFPKPGKPVYHWAPILDDLRRRDFTANAMAVSLNEGSYGLLLDPLNGIADIEARTLRIVSPYGFLEDPSRLLRAVRLASRTGWEMDERTTGRYEYAREEDAIAAIPTYLKGYELEEVVHEEDALKALKALESEGWMKHVFPAWTSAKADAKGLEALHQSLLQLLIQGIHPDLSAAHMELLTAKLAPKDQSSLKRLFAQPGFVKHWEKLDHTAKDFQKELLDKKNAAPSAAWKLLTSYDPEAVLWLAYTSKNVQVQTRFKNFATVWPEARQKIPTTLMLEMRITPDLPGYQELVQKIFFALMDGKLVTEEEMRAFLEPHSPPAPPPPVSVRRTRAKRAKVVEEDEDHDHHESDDEDSGDEGLDDDEHEDNDEDDADIKLAPAKKAVAVKTAKGAAAKAATPEPKGKAAKKVVPEKIVAEHKAAQVKPVPGKSAKPVVVKKASAPAKHTVAAKAPKPVASKSTKVAPKAVAKSAKKPSARSAKVVKKPAKPVAKVVKKPVAKPAKKPATRPAPKPVKKLVAKKAAKAAKPAKKKR